MLEFYIQKKSLENAMKIAFLSTEAAENLLTGHCLFTINGNDLKIYATDKKNRLARISLEISSDCNLKFTADPRKILKLLKTADSDSIKILYDPSNFTIQIFLSNDTESFISLVSFDPVLYAPIEDTFDKAYDLKTVNAGSFLGGLQFIKGFLMDKHPKFSNMFLSKGVMYGANGSNKVAAFQSPDLDELDELVFPLVSLPAISNMITMLDLQEITIGSSSNHIFISSEKKDFIFGFSKIQLSAPKLPITIDEPDFDGWEIDRSIFIKKLTRLLLSGDPAIGIRLNFEDSKISMETVIDRPSKDVMVSKRLKGSSIIKEIYEIRALQTVLTHFGGEKIFLYIKNKIVFRSVGELEFLEKGITVKRPFTSIAAVAPSRED